MRPSWNVQSVKDGEQLEVRLDQKSIRQSIIATMSKKEWRGVPKLASM
jgi:hypothetical protein